MLLHNTDLVGVPAQIFNKCVFASIVKVLAYSFF